MVQWADAETRFFGRIFLSEQGCWVWDKKTTSGYGEFTEFSKKSKAHIWSYLHFVGEYDRTLDLDHTCHNYSGCMGGIECEHRLCVNPAHLEPVTRSENAKRGNCGSHLSSKAYCKHGHEFTDANSIITRLGYRNCRACKNKNETLRGRALRLQQGKSPRRKRVQYAS